jgi:membrane protein implicated in regulation of membrane protease activity
MSTTETLLVLALIFFLVDIFFLSDFPTFIAYVLTTTAAVINTRISFLYQILFGLIFIFILVAFHYLLWKKVLQKINSKFISPRKYIGGYEGLVGKYGVIKNIEGRLVIAIGEEIFQFETQNDVREGESYLIKDIKSSNLII